MVHTHAGSTGNGVALEFRTVEGKAQVLLQV